MISREMASAGKRRVPWILVAGGLAVVGAGIFVGVESRTALRRVNEFYGVDVRGLQTAGEMAFQIQEGRRTVVYALTTNDLNKQLAYIGEARAAGDSVTGLENRLSASRLDRNSRAALNAFTASWDAYLKVRDRIIASILMADGKKGLSVDLEQSYPAFDLVKAALTRLLAELDRSAGERLGYVTGTLRRTMVEVGVLLVGMLFFLKTVGANRERSRTVDALRKVNNELESAQRNLHDREQRLRALFDNVIDAIITIDEHGTIESANRATEVVFGYKPSELTGKNVATLMPAPDSGAHAVYLSRYLQTGNKRIIGIGREVNGLRKDGTQFPLDLAISEIVSQGRRTFVGILRDITERRKGEAALRASQRQLMEVTANIPGAVFQMRPAGNDRFLFISKGIETLIGRTPAEIIANPALMTADVHEEDLPGVLHELRSSLGRGAPFKFTYRVVGQSTDRWLSASAAPRENSAGELVWTGVIIDVTASKESERKLQAYSEQLSAAVARAEAATIAKSQFLATMSHEIRTPLNGVIGMSSLLLETPLSTEQSEYAETIRSSGEALLAIINDILEFSKIEAGKLDLEYRAFDPRSVVEDSLEIVAPMAHRKDLELCAPFGDSVPGALIGDPTRLRQVLLNLLSNAVKFTEAGEVVLSVSCLEKSCLEKTGEERAGEDKEGQEVLVRFEVRDTGIGIGTEAQAKLFQSFSQADSSTTRRFGGTGLGLAICKRLVELMGGEIGAVSQPGAGAKFWFAIPFRTTAESITVPVVAKNLDGRRVLAVDDNGTNRSIVKQQLGKWGIVVACAASGQEALEELTIAARQGRPYELAILDLHMPVMNGLMLAKEIRRNPSICGIPMMMLTSDRDREEAAVARQLDIRIFLVKPVRQANLFRAVGEMFGASARERPRSAGADWQKLNARILVVEDNPTNQKVIVLLLKKFGCVADVAMNGAEAVRAVGLASFDAILMDCQMPVMDGFEATAEIRGNSEVHVPIIALTANALEGERERCMEAGMDDYLSKPVRAEELLKKLQYWIVPKMGVATAPRS